jgi:hypothetical protein
MVDPYAPPTEGPARPPTAYTTGATGLTQETYDRPVERYETPRERRLRHEHERTHERPEPARPGLFWAVAAVGVGLLCLARLLAYFAIQDTLPNDQVAPALFGVLGVLALSAGLALAAVLQRGLQVSWRIALILGAGFFAVVGLPAVPAFGLL